MPAQPFLHFSPPALAKCTLTDCPPTPKALQASTTPRFDLEWTHSSLRSHPSPELSTRNGPTPWFAVFCNFLGFPLHHLACVSDEQVAHSLAGFACFLLRGMDDLLAERGVPPASRPRVSAASTVNNYIAAVLALYEEQGWVRRATELRRRANAGGLSLFL